MNIFKFFRDVKGEMNHMSWPTKNQTIAYTLLVIVISVALSIYVGVFDHIFTLGIEKLIN